MNIFSRPVVDQDGIIYVGSTDGNIYALDQMDGKVVWQYPTGGPVVSSPVLGPDGTIYTGSDDAKLYALNPDGSLLWSAATGGKVRSSAALGKNGSIITGPFISDAMTDVCMVLPLLHHGQRRDRERVIFNL